MKRFSVVVSLPGHNKYLQEQEAVAKSAGDRLGVELRVINAESDPVLQSQQLLEIIQSHSSPMPNAILVEPVNELGLPRVAEAAVNAGIGWVISNARVDYLESLRSRAQAPVFSVSQDHSDIGRILGRQCGALLPDGGTVLYLRGPASNSLAGRRMEGVESALSRNIQFKTLKIQWTEDAAYQTLASWLRLSTVKAKDVHLVASQNTDFVLGAIRAFQGNTQGTERANWMALPFLGVGTASRTKPLVEKGTLRAAVVTSLTMDTALDLLVNALEKGSQPPENTFVPASSLPSLQELARKDRTKSAIAAGI